MEDVALLRLSVGKGIHKSESAKATSDHWVLGNKEADQQQKVPV